MARVSRGRARLWRRGVFGVVIVLATWLTGVPPARAANATVGAITGFGGKCVDVDGGNTVNGTKVQLWTCNETSAQQWTLAGDGTIRAMGKCLDVSWGGTAPGTPVWLWECNGGVAQQWVASAPNGLRNPHSGACLDATGISSADGTPLQIWACTGTANQQWTKSIAKTYVVPLRDNATIPARVMDDDTYTAVLSHEITLRAGEARLVTDQLTISITGYEGAVVENNIRCVDVVTGAETRSTSGTNLLNPSPLNDHPPPATPTTLHNSLLFRAPQAGTYRCELQSYTSDGTRLNYSATAFKRALSAGAWTGTWLEFSPVDEVGSQTWSNGPCPVHGDDATNCEYLDGKADRYVKNVFTTRNGKPTVPPVLWTAPADAVSAQVRANVLVTSCPHGTDSCIEAFWGPGGWGRPDYAGFNAHLEFTQLFPSGAICKDNRTPDQPYTIYNTVHHFPLNYSLNVPISPNCGGSRNFQLKLLVSYRDGNPFKIDGSAGGSSANSANVVVIRTAPTVRVPNVVGGSEAAARTALSNSGLTVGTVTQVAEPGEVGTVRAQNAPANTVEPAGSPVDITVRVAPTTHPSPSPPPGGPGPICPGGGDITVNATNCP